MAIKRKLKIHLHLPNLFVGGIEYWALSLIRGIPEFDWTVSTPSGALSHPVGLSEFAGISVVDEFQLPADLDIAIGCCALPPTPSETCRVMVAHGVAPYYRQEINRFPYDRAVAVSNCARYVFPDPEGVVVITNGVNTSRLYPTRSRVSVRRMLGIDEDALVVGYLGRFTQHKNPLAASLAAACFPDSIALYVSPGPDADKWMEQARHIGNYRYIPGEEVDAIGNFYRACDICVSASDSEGFCLSIAEAWFARVPVVATAAGIAAERPDLVITVPFRPTSAELGHAVEKAVSPLFAPVIDRAEAAVHGYYNVQRMVNEWQSYLLDIARNAGYYSELW